ncbi:hypothetical protein NPIL_435061 [Nephila pilipes]|uniref:Uncharacterized protein n=1 Tax=Nephila pilipes TaxID=299642 RepID=A0A8X6QXT4_NEPPI|nr:hypothetical protein NPIL_435061 [Nephila pilipes]
MGRKKSMGHKKKIPDRWLDYYPLKEAIYDARIIPIKCPLPSNLFTRSNMRRYCWTPEDVMHAIPNLGLIIDITNKHPAYYDPNEFISNGIDYVKIPCVGHVIPDSKVFRRLREVISLFLMRNNTNDRIIALHCTHGVNRTGYLICRYLIQQLGYSPDEALQNFALQRGYPIERANYIENLYNFLPAAV